MREISDYVPGLWGRETTCCLTPTEPDGVILEVEEHRKPWDALGAREYAQVCLSIRAVRELHAQLGELIKQAEAV